MLRALFARIGRHFTLVFVLFFAVIGGDLLYSLYQFYDTHKNFVSVNFDSVYNTRAMLKARLLADKFLSTLQTARDYSDRNRYLPAADFLEAAILQEKTFSYYSGGTNWLAPRLQSLQTQLTALQAERGGDIALSESLAKLIKNTRALILDMDDAERDSWGELSAMNSQLNQRLNVIGAQVANITVVFAVMAAVLAWLLFKKAAAEAKLKAIVAEFEIILERSPVGIVLTFDRGKETIIARANEKFAQIAERHIDDLVGSSLYETLDRFGKVNDSSREELTAALKAGKPYSLEGQLSRPNGEVLWYKATCKAIDPPDLGNGIIWLYDDITEKRTIEHELRELNATLERRVEDRTNKLQAANADLSTALDTLMVAQGELLRAEKLAALGSLVAGIAHELNTPIGNSLMVASTLRAQTNEIVLEQKTGLKRSVFEAYLQDSTHAADILIHNLHRAAELVTSFKQVAVDQTSSQRRRFQLDEAISEIIVTLGPSIKKSPYSVEHSIAPNIQMDGFPGPLGQVITNLINNAIIHGFEGRARGTVHIQGSLFDSNHIELKISDDGKGIPAANIGRIFDPFFTTKLGHGGSGLGLNIVHSIVTGILGGKITVASEVGQGTTFTLILPTTAMTVAATAEL